jgi:hypothetical protein
MNITKIQTNTMEDIKTNVRIVLASIWSAHFLLWTFGDMASLLQQITKPATDNILLLVAAPTAVAQALMIVLSLVAKNKLMRWISQLAAIVFLGFDIGYMVDAQFAWQYLLGTAYLLFDGLIIWYAWKWARKAA